MKEILYIGIDDTDTNKGGCTTYLASLLLEYIYKLGYKPYDYPLLVRLNPNIPYKTRGNAAVCLTFYGENDLIEKVLNFLNESSYLFEENGEKPQPVICFYKGEKNPQLYNFYIKCLTQHVDLNEAIKLAKNLNIRYYEIKRGLMGLIGALASIGADFKDEFTYELLAYRKLEEKNLKRYIQTEKVLEIEKKFNSLIFHNFDYKKKRILITPHGKDPVLFGIRGYNPYILIEAFKMLNVNNVERWTIFKTNQGTDAHLKYSLHQKNFNLYSVVFDEFKVISKPKIIQGGHIIISIKHETGEIFDLAIYKESGEINEKARKLIENDIIIVGGGIKKIINGVKVINCEKLIIKKLAKDEIKIKPTCVKCGITLKSLGDGKGMRCEKCKYKINFTYQFLTCKKREISEGEILIPPPRSRRHLSKPLETLNIKPYNKLIEKFFQVINKEV